MYDLAKPLPIAAAFFMSFSPESKFCSQIFKILNFYLVLCSPEEGEAELADSRLVLPLAHLSDAHHLYH